MNAASSAISSTAATTSSTSTTISTSQYEVYMMRIRDVLLTQTASSSNNASTTSSKSIGNIMVDNQIIASNNVLKTLYSLIMLVIDEIDRTPDAVLLANTNLVIIDDVINGKSSSYTNSSNTITLSKSFQALLSKLYLHVLLKAPGYVVRNVIGNLLNIASAGKGSSSSKECAASIIGAIISTGTRVIDCGSMINEIIQCFIKIIKGSDVVLRHVCFDSIASMIAAAGSRISDTYVDIVKIAAKYVTDKSFEVRTSIAHTVAAIALHHKQQQPSTNSSSASSSATMLSTDALLVVAIKGLEDDVLHVQELYAAAISSIFYRQICADSDAKLEAKASNNRGSNNSSGSSSGVISNVSSNSSKSNSGSGDSTAKKSAALSMSKVLAQKLTSVTGGGVKKIVDDYSFRSVVEHIVKQISATITNKSSSSGSSGSISSRKRGRSR